ncbi:MAG TPA: PaaI family thioesterase [Acidimicrobiales bacterium]|nr:PaaI family thioesterase [Acidimicrobiales bacterium]
MALMTIPELQEFLVNAFPDSPSTLIVEDAGEWGARLRLPVTKAHGRPGGTVSGPALMGLADGAAWLSILTQIGPVALAVTTSLHIDFLRKPPLADVLAHGQILKLGKSLAVVDVSLRADGTDELVAKAQVTYSIPPR